MPKKHLKTKVQTSFKRKSGFKAISSLLGYQTKNVVEKRGFTVTRVLTHWREIVGEDISLIAKPIKIGSNQQGLGSTLTVLCLGAYAPILQTMLNEIREKVNSVYGYSAISKVRITQTGTFEGFNSEVIRKNIKDEIIDPKVLESSEEISSPISNEDLRKALQELGKNVLLSGK